MNRLSVRPLSALALILSLSLLLTSPVVAQPVHPAKLAPAEEPSWLDTALAFLSQWLEKKQSAPSNDSPIVQPNTGACIDPLGNPCVVYPNP